MEKGTTYTQTTIEQVKTALIESHGIITVTAQNLGITEYAVRERIRKNPELQECMKECRASFVDHAEGKLWEKLNEGEWRAIEFTLRTLGRDRGFGDTKDINLNSVNMNGEIDMSKLDKLSPEEKALFYETLNKLSVSSDSEGDV